MDVGIKQSVQPFVNDGYCVFEDDILVDLPDVLGPPITPIPLF